MAGWSASNTPDYNIWDGSSFGTASPATDMGSRWRIMAASTAPIRDEKIVVGIESGAEVSGQMLGRKRLEPAPDQSPRQRESDILVGCRRRLRAAERRCCAGVERQSQPPLQRMER